MWKQILLLTTGPIVGAIGATLAYDMLVPEGEKSRRGERVAVSAAAATGLLMGAIAAAMITTTPTLPGPKPVPPGPFPTPPVGGAPSAPTAPTAGVPMWTYYLGSDEGLMYVYRWVGGAWQLQWTGMTEDTTNSECALLSVISPAYAGVTVPVYHTDALVFQLAPQATNWKWIMFGPTNANGTVESNGCPSPDGMWGTVLAAGAVPA